MDWRPLARLPAGVFSGVVEVKFHDGLQPRVAGHAVVDHAGRTLLRIDGPLAAARPTLRQDPKWLREIEKDAEIACGCDVADMSAYFRFQADVTGEALKLLLERLNGERAVEVAYPLARHMRPPLDLSPTTPAYGTYQGYLQAAPDGINVADARVMPGGDGAGISFVDMEVDWTSDHEDLDTCLDKLVPGVGSIYPGLEYGHYRAHGTAVLSIVAAGENDYGVTGIAPKADCNYAPDFTVENGANASHALLTSYESGAVGAGDVFIMESQTAGPDYDENTEYGLVPSEWEPAVYDSIRTLTALNVVIIEAAGNGYVSLDASRYGGAFERSHDSGAIVVGAGYPPGFNVTPRSRMEYSNYGARLDVQGWGYAVYSAGYGDLFNGGGDERQYYTQEFAGTSSASPIVAGAAILVQSVQRAGGADLITPAQLRELLTATGTPQEGNTAENIGPQPNVGAALAGARVCGNGRRDVGEACEDGNTTGGDGCSADCASNEQCGNGKTDSHVGEACDDGNTAGGDGCSADCRSTEVCGNGVVDGVRGEVCDDGNTADGDGCSASCASNETCGNGVVDPVRDEECDDGNTNDGDDCEVCKMPLLVRIRSGNCAQAGGGMQGILVVALAALGARRGRRKRA